MISYMSSHCTYTRATFQGGSFGAPRALGGTGAGQGGPWQTGAGGGRTAALDMVLRATRRALLGYLSECDV